MTDVLDPSAALTVTSIDATEGLSDKPESFTRQAWDRFRKHRIAIAGAVMFVLITLSFIVGPWIVPYEFDEVNVIDRSLGPSWEHPFGTDPLGRDLLERTLIGGRISLLIAIVTSVIATTIGTIMGAISGYFGGLVDTVTNWVINLFLTIPLIAILLVFGVKFGGSPLTTGLMIAAFGWVGTARVVRSQFVQYKNMEFVQAARAAGAGPGRIIFRHILPNTLGPILVAATLLVGTAIILESTLSFLALGVKPPDTSLGVLVAEAKGEIANSPSRILFPGFFITAIVLSINFLGDGMRDALDPTSKVGD